MIRMQRLRHLVQISESVEPVVKGNELSRPGLRGVRVFTNRHADFSQLEMQ
jgi:hypothetical protein